MIKFLTFPTIEEALVVQSLLRANDIPASLDNYHHASNDWYIVPTLGGVRVIFPDRTAANAISLIKSYQDETAPALEAVFGTSKTDDTESRYVRAWSLFHITPREGVPRCLHSQIC